MMFAAAEATFLSRAVDTASSAGTTFDEIDPPGFTSGVVALSGSFSGCISGGVVLPGAGASDEKVTYWSQSVTVASGMPIRRTVVRQSAVVMGE